MPSLVNGWRMRFFFLIVLLAGLALGIGYPLAVKNVSGYEIGTFPMLEDGGGYRPAEVSIAPSEAPVRVRIMMQVADRFTPSKGTPIYRMTVMTGDRLVFEQVVTFNGAEPKSAPQGRDLVYEEDVATIDPIDGADLYIFTIEPTIGGGDIAPSRVDLILNAGAFDLDPRAVPIGYMLIVIGFVGFVAMVRRRRNLNRANPPPPRWGRGANDRE